MVEESDAGEPMSAVSEPTSAGGPKVSFAPAKIPGELRHCPLVTGRLQLVTFLSGSTMRRSSDEVGATRGDFGVV